ncbi:hypothetical protein P8452_66842 [Trifolium repens]|nr:hypothetical protein P8452_66842 [Trifolium repens]
MLITGDGIVVQRNCRIVTVGMVRNGKLIDMNEIVESGDGIRYAYKRLKMRSSGPTATAMWWPFGWTAIRAGATSVSFLVSVPSSSSIFAI